MAVVCTTDYRTEFAPRDYLRQFYSTPHLPGDERAIARFLWEKLEPAGVVGCGLEFGCGPTVHHAFGLAPYVRELHLCDYLPGNRDEIQRWLDDSPDAHDWNPQFAGLIDIDGVGQPLAARCELLRQRATRLWPCDLFASPAISCDRSYDLVASFYTAECLGASLPEWEQFMARILALVRPGGRVVFGALRRATRYSVLGKWFANTPVDEGDFERVLRSNGCDPATLDCRAVPIPDWVDDGFDSIVLAYGQKQSGFTR